jgi:hypothetical protein
VLSTHYNTILSNIVTNISIKIVNQTAGNPSSSSNSSTFPLNTTINVTGYVDASSQYAVGTNFSELIVNATTRNVTKLVSALTVADVVTGNTTSYFSTVQSINASVIVPKVKSTTTQSTKKESLSAGVTTGIMVGIFAVLCVGVYIASIFQGDHLLQREIAREEKRAAAELKTATAAAAANNNNKKKAETTTDDNGDNQLPTTTTENKTNDDDDDK